MKAGNKVGLMSQMSQIALGCLTCSYSAPGRPHAPRRRQLAAGGSGIARLCRTLANSTTRSPRVIHAPLSTSSPGSESCDRASPGLFSAVQRLLSKQWFS